MLAPERGREGYDALVRDLVARGAVPTRVAHLWLVTDRETFRPGSSFFHRNQEQGFYSLLFLAQAMGDENLPTPLEITVVTSGAAQVRGEPLPHPEKATVLGPVRVIPRELPGVTCRLLDVALPAVERPRRPRGRSAGADRRQTRWRSLPTRCSRSCSPRRPAPSPRSAAAGASSSSSRLRRCRPRGAGAPRRAASA